MTQAPNPRMAKRCLAKAQGRPKRRWLGAHSAAGYLDGECGHCNKWGHKRADRRKRIKDEPTATSTIPTSASQPLSPHDGETRAIRLQELGDDASCVFVLTKVVIDSGSSEHICRATFAHCSAAPAALSWLQTCATRAAWWIGVRRGIRGDDLLFLGRLSRNTRDTGG